jgi:alpha-beta hydrolase superfamily lysophospholipase
VEITTPAPSGPHAVGRRQFAWTDDSRPEIPAPHTGPHRRLVVWVWYPAQAGGRTAAAIPPGWVNAFAKQVSRFGEQAAEPYLARRVHAVEGAAPARTAGGFPVVLFFPGFSWMPTDYSYLIENLVSRGYVVAGVNPTGFVETSVFGKDDAVGRSPLTLGSDMDYEALFRWWVDDAHFVRRRIEALNADAGDPLAGHLDTGRLGIFGHSFGGATAAQALAEDASFRAGINLDGGLYGSVLSSGVIQPFMLVNAHSDFDAAALPPEDRARITASVAKWDRGWAGFLDASPLAVMLTVRRTHHGSFSDFALLPESLKKPEKDPPAAGFADGEAALRLLSASVNEFFDAKLAAAETHGPPCAPHFRSGRDTRR